MGTIMGTIMGKIGDLKALGIDVYEPARKEYIKTMRSVIDEFAKHFSSLTAESIKCNANADFSTAISKVITSFCDTYLFDPTLVSSTIGLNSDMYKANLALVNALNTTDYTLAGISYTNYVLLVNNKIKNNNLEMPSSLKDPDFRKFFRKLYDGCKQQIYTKVNDIYEKNRALSKQILEFSKNVGNIAINNTTDAAKKINTQYDKQIKNLTDMIPFVSHDGGGGVPVSLESIKKIPGKLSDETKQISGKLSNETWRNNALNFANSNKTLLIDATASIVLLTTITLACFPFPCIEPYVLARTAKTIISLIKAQENITSRWEESNPTPDASTAVSSQTSTPTAQTGGDSYYLHKYQKYKAKYLQLKSQH